MAAHEEWIDVRLQLRNAAAFIAEANKAGIEVRQLGTQTEVAGAKARAGSRGFDMFRRGAERATTGGLIGKMKGIGGSWFHAAKGILAAGAAFASYEGAKRAIENTDALAQTTLRLTKNTAFDVQTASRWAAVATARGIDANRLGQTLAKLSKTVEGGLHGQKASVDLWNQLGISQQDLMNANKDMPGFLGKIADRFQALGPGTQRTTIAQGLFGRSWQTLIPLLRDGSGALNDQLKLAGKYGAQFDEKGLGSVESFIKKQREMKFATLGLQISFAQFLIPALTKLIGWFNASVLWFRKNHEVTDVLKGALKGLGFVLGLIGKLIGSNSVSARLFGVALTALLALAVAGKFIKWGRALYDTAKTLKIVTAAQWLWNAALAANPIILIIIALVALGVGFVLLYKKVAWFRNAVNAAWKWIKNAAVTAFNFIKKHWGLMLTIMTGGLAAPIVFIIKHWKAIRNAGGAAINWLSKAWSKGTHFIANLFIGIWKTAKSVWNGIVDAGKTSINFLISIFNSAIDAINSVTPGDINLPFGVTIPGIPDIPKIPLLAEGGIIRSLGMAVVGERGPEVLTLPAGARVDPLPAAPSGSQPGGPAKRLSERFAEATARHLNLTIPVMLNGREIGRANSKFTDDERARA